MMLFLERKFVLEHLVKHSYQRKSEKFKLSSGEENFEYIDCRLSLSNPKVLKIASSLVFNALDWRSTAVGSLTTGADPISIGTSMLSSTRDREIKWFSVRKNFKQYGLNKLIEGDVLSEERVTIVDDVISTGASIIKAVRAARELGLDVVQVIALIDRQEFNGRQNVEIEACCPVISIFTLGEIASVSSTHVSPKT